MKEINQQEKWKQKNHLHTIHQLENTMFHHISQRTTSKEDKERTRQAIAFSDCFVLSVIIFVLI